MSLDQALSTLVAAINANTAALQYASAPQATLQQAPPQVQQPSVNTWVPQQSPPGMPPAPNFGLPPQAAPPVQAAPFTSQQDLYDYCTHVYQANNLMGPRMEAILKQMTPGGEASQIQPTQYGQFYAAVEAARAV